MNCLGCAKLNLQAYKAHAKEGMGRCPEDPPATFVSFTFERSCGKFAAAKPEVVEARIAWNKKRQLFK